MGRDIGELARINESTHVFVCALLCYCGISLANIIIITRSDESELPLVTFSSDWIDATAAAAAAYDNNNNYTCNKNNNNNNKSVHNAAIAYAKAFVCIHIFDSISSYLF